MTKILKAYIAVISNRDNCFFVDKRIRLMYDISK